MKSVAIIPLRAGSKGIPNKNKLKVLGRPLFTWVLTEAIFSKLNEIYVFTDDEDIITYISNEYKWSKKVKVVKRSAESASDTASTEFAMLELAEKIDFDFDYYCLLQATSPLTKRTDINKAIETVSSTNVDSALSVVETKRFVWNKAGKSINYDYLNRPRRQDFDGMLIENGAVYISTKERYIESKNRISGKIQPFLMAEESLVEIDEKSDLLIIKQLLAHQVKSKGAIGRIKVLCLDVDGVFTKATLAVSKDGEFSKEFSLRDGMGLENLRMADVDIIVLTSENSEIVQKRMAKLNIKDVYLGIKDKYSFLDKLCTEKGISRSEIAYIGDDINDLANIAACGLGMCPKDAENEVKEMADLVLSNNGGERVIREACEFIVKHNGRF